MVPKARAGSRSTDACLKPKRSLLDAFETRKRRIACAWPIAVASVSDDRDPADPARFWGNLAAALSQPYLDADRVQPFPDGGLLRLQQLGADASSSIRVSQSRRASAIHVHHRSIAAPWVGPLLALPFTDRFERNMADRSGRRVLRRRVRARLRGTRMRMRPFR